MNQYPFFKKPEEPKNTLPSPQKGAGGTAVAISQKPPASSKPSPQELLDIALEGKRYFRWAGSRPSSYLPCMATGRR